LSSDQDKDQLARLGRRIYPRQGGGSPLQAGFLTRRAGDRDLEALRDRLAEGLAAEAGGVRDAREGA
jgi:hypothetical protein